MEGFKDKNERNGCLEVSQARNPDWRRERSLEHSRMNRFPTNKTVLELPLSHSHTFTHAYTYIPRAKFTLHMLQNNLKAQNTEHHIISNTPASQDDLRLPRRHI